MIVGIMVAREYKGLRDFFQEPLWFLFVVLAAGIWFSSRYAWLLYVPVKLRWQIHLVYSLAFATTLVTQLLSDVVSLRSILLVPFAY